MAKKQDAQIDTVLTCEHCGETRFQVHERGIVLVGEDAVDVRYDEMACQCLQCHQITVIDLPQVFPYTD